ncbi:hypothetical protein PWR66_07735 [Paraburkholderia sp. A1RO-5]|uniref:hypothetical protein n=1 Tax=Paraburkholderia sp. A1RO-5 TaxID=3028369 RepID=UPI003B828F3C
MTLRTQLYIGGALALVLLGVYAGRKATQAGGAVSGAFSAVDGAATDAVFSVPGMTLFQDPATGNFDPVAAGYASGAATRQWIIDEWNNLFSSPPASQSAPVTDMAVPKLNQVPDPIAGVF